MKKLLCLLLALILFVSLTACEKNESEETDADEFSIVTSLYPVYVATLNIIDGASGVSLRNLIDPSLGCAHGYLLDGQDIRSLAGSDLFIASGMGMEVFVGKSSLGVPGLDLLDCGEDIERIIGEEGNIQNIHYWMDIENAIEQCQKIKRTLCRMNPENAEIYEKNAAEYTEKLSELIGESARRIDALPKKSVVMYHDSLEYYTKEFGISSVIIPSDEDISEQLKKEAYGKPEYVLTQEDLSKSDGLRKVTKALGCTVMEVKTVMSGELGKAAKNAYIEAVQHNLGVLEQVLGK